MCLGVRDGHVISIFFACIMCAKSNGFVLNFNVHWFYQ